jgi:hypothetical protein
MMTTGISEPLLREATSNMLEMHLSEILEECENIVEYGRKLRQDDLPTDDRDTLEGELYAAISHLHNHVDPALQEWDRVDEALPEEDD